MTRTTNDYRAKVKFLTERIIHCTIWFKQFKIGHKLSHIRWFQFKCKAHLLCPRPGPACLLLLLLSLGLMGASLFCSHLAHCSCQHIQILGGTLNPLFYLTISSIHAWARPPSHPTDTPASMINSPLLGLSIHSAHCWEPLKQDNSCIPSSH